MSDWQLEPLHERLRKVMVHVAMNTNDQWARDYLFSRLEDLGFERHKFVVKTEFGHFNKVPQEKPNVGMPDNMRT